MGIYLPPFLQQSQNNRYYILTLTITITILSYYQYLNCAMVVASTNGTCISSTLVLSLKKAISDPLLLFALFLPFIFCLHVYCVTVLISDRTLRLEKLQLDRTPKKKASGQQTHVEALTMAASESLRQNLLQTSCQGGILILDDEHKTSQIKTSR